MKTAQHFGWMRVSPLAPEKSHQQGPWVLPVQSLQKPRHLASKRGNAWRSHSPAFCVSKTMLKPRLPWDCTLLTGCPRALLPNTAAVSKPSQQRTRLPCMAAVGTAKHQERSSRNALPLLPLSWPGLALCVTTGTQHWGSSQLPTLMLFCDGFINLIAHHCWST